MRKVTVEWEDGQEAVYEGTSAQLLPERVLFVAEAYDGTKGVMIPLFNVRVIYIEEK